jgi:hypothetical protein
MDQLCIRHALEEKVRALGGSIEGGGSMVVPPFTMDFSFELSGKHYEVTLVDREEKRNTQDQNDLKE